MAVSKIKVVFSSDIETVWELVTSLENYFMKPFLRMYLKKQQESYIRDLEKH